MPDFPVRVLRTESGDYTASLVDLTNGPTGQGVDPYAALEDLAEPAKEALHLLNQRNALPTPSDIDDQPVISFDPDNDLDSKTSDAFNVAVARYSKTPMICYSWTNVTVLTDS